MAIVDWSKVQTALLDMDGTLLDLRFDNYFWQEYVIEIYAQTHGEDFNEAKLHVDQLIANERGKLTWYCLDFWSDALRLDIAQLKHDARHHVSIRPGTLDFLKWLKEQPLEVVLCTNAHQAGMAVKLEESGIEPYFDHIVSSHSFGAAKESQDFWQAFQQMHQFEPSSSLMLDDSLSVLNAARTFGIGQVVAIDKPDSQRPANTITDFPTITYCNELIA